MVSLSVTLVEQEVRPKSDYTASLELIPLQITADRPMGQHKANVCHTSLISVEIVLFRSASVQAASSGYISIYQKKKKKSQSQRPSSCNSYAVRWALFTFLQQNEIIQECQKFSQIYWKKILSFAKGSEFWAVEFSTALKCRFPISVHWSDLLAGLTQL